ncbi:hypothetical protein [uncultured Methylibium sp.]|uniref:hypothetical protein n=1 Tax=uncultured Methylibium sp. TaxID=381093 RepID=UPI0025D106F6|nr:hypothetical protein [uncultured Methylibium sp.]
MQQRPTLTVIAAAIAASAATLMLALAPAFAPSNSQESLRVVELPRVTVTATRQPRAVELPRVVIHAKRDAAADAQQLAGARVGPQPLMSRQPR